MVAEATAASRVSQRPHVYSLNCATLAKAVAVGSSSNVKLYRFVISALVKADPLQPSTSLYLHRSKDTFTTVSRYFLTTKLINPALPT